MLKGVNRPESQDGWQYFSNQHSISWKTGTSYGYRDAWSVGVTKDYTVVVWVGNADGEGRNGLTGVRKAAPVLFSVFDLLPVSKEIKYPIRFFKPKELCEKSGFLATEDCEHIKIDYVPSSSHYLPTCPYHHSYMMDTISAYAVNSTSNNLSKAVRQSFFVLDPITNSYSKKFSGIDYLAPQMSKISMNAEQNLGIIYPTQNAVILLPKDVNGQKHDLISSVSVGSGVDSIFWFLDHELIEITNSVHKVTFKADLGDHLLTVVTPSGNQRSHEFSIRE